MGKKNYKRVTDCHSSLQKIRAQLTSPSLPKLILEGYPLSQHPMEVLASAPLAYLASFVITFFKKIHLLLFFTLFLNYFFFFSFNGKFAVLLAFSEFFQC